MRRKRVINSKALCFSYFVRTFCTASIHQDSRIQRSGSEAGAINNESNLEMQPTFYLIIYTDRPGPPVFHHVNLVALWQWKIFFTSVFPGICLRPRKIFHQPLSDPLRITWVFCKTIFIVALYVWFFNRHFINLATLYYTTMTCVRHH